MNQIIYIHGNKEIKDETPIQDKHSNILRNFFIFQLCISTIITLGLASYYIYSLYEKSEKEKLSQKLVNNFNISRLYSDETYNSVRTSNVNFYELDQNKFNVIGIIEINSIGINYPILSTVSNDLLKIAPCRFYGPMPNEIGNMCIAGHNYNNYKFFSKLKNLKIGDIINIYDLSGNKILYSIYDSYETNYNDLSCTNQNTNGEKEITLITCNNIKDKRRIIKAKEKR